MNECPGLWPTTMVVVSKLLRAFNLTQKPHDGWDENKNEHDLTFKVRLVRPNLGLKGVI